jgi:hypothetical protein
MRNDPAKFDLAVAHRKPIDVLMMSYGAPETDKELVV